jgi:CubicO group peptidase (beta-lactamase class C family)/GNAT superfamily N-acetyltransferase
MGKIKPGFAIRTMVSADAPACAAIACASEIGRRYGFEAGALAAKLEAALRGTGNLFVADSGDAIAGFVWAEPLGAFSSAPYLRLIAVAESARGSGVGSALLAEFEARTASVGRDWCLLVSDFNEGAQSFYERHGYRRVGVLPDFAVPGIAEVLMTKPRTRGRTHPITRETIDSLVEARLAEAAFRGLVLRVERVLGGGVAEGRSELLFEKAWGHAVFTESERICLESSTLFDLASVSKLFTATAILRLVTLGKLGLDSKVVDLITPLGVLPSSLRGRLATSLGDVDVAALLDHSSGIHYWYPFYTRGGATFETILADVCDVWPREGHMIYSDLNFMILGRILERTTRLSLEGAMRELVFEPLGLGRSSYGRPLGPAAATEFGNRIERNMVAELGLAFDGWRDESRPIRGAPDDGNCHYYFGGAAGHAGVFSDAADLCRLGRLYLEGGRVLGAPYLAPGLAEDALRDRGQGRGLGFQCGENYPGGGSGHMGFTGTYLHVNSGSGLVIAILANRLHVPEPGDLTPFRRELAAAVLAAFD